MFSAKPSDTARETVVKVILEMVVDLTDARQDPTLAKQILGRIAADLTALCDLPASKG